MALATAVALLLAMSAVAAESVAGPLVLYDSGQTIPIDPLMAPLRPKPQPQPTPPAAPQLTLGNYGLPVRTPSMTPGRVASRSLPALHGKMIGASPIFLIGADQLSLQWLQQHQARLSELQAVGMVVSVEREADLQILRQAAGALKLIAASGEALAQHLGLQHYPVLIAPPGLIEQ